jgi:hypothetical protein
MAWLWRYERTESAGADVAQEGTPEDPPTFSSQSDAESWIGEEWQTLLAAGVDAVTLLEDEREVYGPMSLHPPAE